MKLRLLAASVAALVLASGAVVAQTATPAPAAAGPSDKTLLSYAIGYDLARDMADRKVDLDMSTLIRGIQEGYAKKDPTLPGDKLAASLSAFQKRMADQDRAEFEKVARDNKARSDAFLSANKAKPGVVTLPGGVQYKIIDAGTGPKPTLASTVSVHLRGSITTGQEFANTYNTPTAQPVSFKISEYPIAGVREVLVLMPVGSRWEVYIPSEKALGNEPRSPIGPGQAVIFDIKLVSSK
jgi:peptidylprolyl isomerase